MYRERTSWEEESKSITSTMLKQPAPPAGIPDMKKDTKEGKTSECSTSGEATTNRGRQDERAKDSASAR